MMIKILIARQVWDAPRTVRISIRRARKTVRWYNRALDWCDSHGGGYGERFADDSVGFSDSAAELLKLLHFIPWHSEATTNARWMVRLARRLCDKWGRPNAEYKEVIGR